MRIVIVGQQWFAERVLREVAPAGSVVAVLGTAGACRFTTAAVEAGIPVSDTMEDLGRRMDAVEVDLLVTAHATRFVPAEIRRKARAAVGYHPSLLPRHRGKRSVQATIEAGDAIAGGSVFHLTDGFDEGPIVAQDWSFVPPGITAGDLWRQELAPLGIRLLQAVVSDAAAGRALGACQQDERFATSC